MSIIRRIKILSTNKTKINLTNKPVPTNKEILTLIKQHYSKIPKWAQGRCGSFAHLIHTVTRGRITAYMIHKTYNGHKDADHMIIKDYNTIFDSQRTYKSMQAAADYAGEGTPYQPYGYRKAKLAKPNKYGDNMWQVADDDDNLSSTLTANELVEFYQLLDKL